MTIKKPNSRNQLLPPFDRIGDSGWDEALRTLLLEFGVPLPEPSAVEQLDEREQSLGVAIPASLRTFLLVFGPVDFDYVQTLPPAQIANACDLWFAQSLNDDLNAFVSVANAGGPDNQFLLSARTGECFFANHSPPSLERCLGSFDELIRIACVDLYTSYYGWDDEELLEMRNAVMQDLFSFVL